MRKSGKLTREEAALQDFLRVLNLLRECHLALVNAAEELPFLKEICRIVVDIGGHPLAWVGYAEEEGRRVLPVAWSGEDGSYIRSLNLTWDDSEPGRSPTGLAIRTGRPALCHDLQTDPQFAPWRTRATSLGLASCLSLPLTGPEGAIGALTIYGDRTEAFSSSEVDLLSHLARAAAYGVLALRTRSERQQLRARLELKEQMLDFARESIFVQDLEGRFLCFNQATYHDLGYNAEELLKLNRFQLEPPEYAQLLESRLKELMAQGQAEFDSAHFRKDSTVLPLHLRSRLLELDDQAVILTAAQNMSDYQRAAGEFKELAGRYRNILENTQVGVFRLRLSDGKFLECNQRLAQMLGFESREELLAEFVPVEHYVDPATLEKLLAGVKNGDLINFEVRLLRRDNAMAHLLLSGRLHPDRSCLDGIATDVSDLRRVEEELRQSEDKYRSLVEQQLGRSLLYAMERHRLKQDLHRERELSERLIQESDDGILAFDRNYRLTLWNKGLEAITGLSKRKVHGKNVFKVLPFLKEIQEEHQVFGNSPHPRFLDQERMTKLSPIGMEGFFDGHFFPLHSESGEVIGGLAFIRNITEQKKLERTLQEKSRLLEDLFGNMQDGITLVDKDFTIRQTNPVVEKWFGFAKPLVGRKCFEVYQGQDEPCKECPTRRTLETGVVGKEVVPRRGPRGEQLGWLEIHSYPLLDQETGTCVGVIEHAVDITAHREKDEVLREAQDRYDLIVTNYPVVVARIYPDGSADFYDDRIETMTGYTRGDFASRRVKWTDLLVEEDFGATQKILSLVPGADKSYFREYQAKTRHGRTIWLQESGQVVFGPDGKIDHLNVVLFDITERKQTEEIKPKLEAQLRQAQRMEAIGTLAGGIAHDFNNILGVMLGYTEMALYAMTEDSALKRKLQQVLKAGQRGKDLVSQILAFSRPSKQERRPVGLHALIKETLKMMRATVPTTVEFRINAEKDRDTIMADPTQIHQVLVNLCANASHAMREKGGLLEVGLKAVDLDDKAAAQYHDLVPGPYVMLSVSDTGHGMDKGVMERIFDPFFTTKKPGEGTGMGLAVVHGIVRAHGGAITVHSEQGKGSVFTILLPRISDVVVAGDKEGPKVDQGQGRILFVDDEEWLVEMWKEILENLGFEVDGKTSSLEALELFRSQPEKFDLVITDQTMANMTGFELAKEMLKLRPKLPLILCTGYSDLITPERTKEAGIKEFCMKPLSISELTGAIHRALGTKPRTT